jgi:hypothetical protein
MSAVPSEVAYFSIMNYNFVSEQFVAEDEAFQPHGTVDF